MLGTLNIHMQKNEIESLSHTVYKDQLKINYTVPETVKLLEESTGKKSLLTLVLERIFLVITPKHRQQNQKYRQVGLHQTKLLHSKGKTFKRLKKHLIEWEKIFANHIAGKGLIYKEYT